MWHTVVSHYFFMFNYFSPQSTFKSDLFACYFYKSGKIAAISSDFSKGRTRRCFKSGGTAVWSGPIKEAHHQHVPVTGARPKMEALLGQEITVPALLKLQNAGWVARRR